MEVSVIIISLSFLFVGCIVGFFIANRAIESQRDTLMDEYLDSQRNIVLLESMLRKLGCEVCTDEPSGWEMPSCVNSEKRIDAL